MSNEGALRVASRMSQTKDVTAATRWLILNRAERRLLDAQREDKPLSEINQLTDDVIAARKAFRLSCRSGKLSKAGQVALDRMRLIAEQEEAEKAQASLRDEVQQAAALERERNQAEVDAFLESIEI